MGVVKGGARVGAGNLDKFEIVVLSTLGECRIGVFEQICRLLARHLRVGVPTCATPISRNTSGISVFGKPNFGISNFGVP